MIGVSLLHGNDPWISKQKHVPFTLQIVELHLHVGPQQQQGSGMKMEARSTQHVHCAKLRAAHTLT
jgi:hypothetical protein